MQITSKFTMAVHIITAIDYFHDTEKVTSKFLARSVGANPVIVRNVMGELKDAGIIAVSQGKSGITLAKRLDEITFFDVYQAVSAVSDEGLFHFHENPNANCPVGRNIHKSVDGKLNKVQHAMEEELKKITLADVVDDTRKAITEEAT
ncbi:MAG: Rrf2 family transcriptional regulator [Lachnospiraceae bacterium]|jgi:DNA-binding IscR family transcriptional regulator|nr:Rrf2 family transcriptional regulator [Lachnospiraceae bacterium]MCI1329053.1 Rrf2 family transcriptional regulator [Lachnospiraceae bacterium]